MAPPPATPTALRPTGPRQLLTTPRIGNFLGPQAGSEIGEDGDVYDAGRQPEATPTPPEAVPATSHQAHEMLRSLTGIIDGASLNPEEPSSILYRAQAVDAILNTTVVPRLMRVDKDVKDILYMR